MKHDTLIYIVIGSAIIGVAYYLWKQEQAPPPTASGGFGTTANTALGYILGGAVGAAAGYFESN